MSAKPTVFQSRTSAADWWTQKTHWAWKKIPRCTNTSFEGFVWCEHRTLTLSNSALAPVWMKENTKCLEYVHPGGAGAASSYYTLNKKYKFRLTSHYIREHWHFWTAYAYQYLEVYTVASLCQPSALKTLALQPWNYHQWSSPRNVKRVQRRKFSQRRWFCVFGLIQSWWQNMAGLEDNTAPRIKSLVVSPWWKVWWK